MINILVSIEMDVSKNSGTPKSSILIWFSIINHPFWGTPMFGFNILAYALLGACLWSRFHRLPGFPRQKLLCRKRPECHRAVFWHWDDYPHLGLHIAEIDQICWWKTCGTCGTCVGREGIEKIPKWERCNSMGNMRICISYMVFSTYVHVKTKPRFVLTKSTSSAKCSFRSLCSKTETYKSYGKMSSWKEHVSGSGMSHVSTMFPQETLRFLAPNFFLIKRNSWEYPPPKKNNKNYTLPSVSSIHSNASYYTPRNYNMSPWKFMVGSDEMSCKGWSLFRWHLNFQGSTPKKENMTKGTSTILKMYSYWKWGFSPCHVNLQGSTRWAPSSYKWSYNPYKWPYKWLTVLITLVIGVINPVITGGGPTL